MKKFVWCLLIAIGVFAFVWKINDGSKNNLDVNEDFFFSIKSSAPQKLVLLEKIDDLTKAYHIVNFTDDGDYVSNIYYVYTNSKAFNKGYSELKNIIDYNYDELWIRVYDSEGQSTYESYLENVQVLLDSNVYEMVY